MSKLFDDLMESAKDIGNYLNNKDVHGITVKTVEIAPLAEFGPKKIKKLRQRLKLSQAVFAGVVGVSDKAVQAWEAGTNHPNGPALRMIDLLDRQPDAILPIFLSHP